MAQAQEGPEVGGPTLSTVANAVRERWRDETAVSARRGVGNAAGLEQDHVPAGIGLLRQQRGPEAAEPPAHDEQVADDAAAEGRHGRRPRRVVEPEDRGLQ
ncbi:unannotated protein [freshwater metagenome]|uniref:Unannotated protein n=1 Tax=freshwater metagenome TaxID=449393 RepID=A0A6J7E167_9ZZZZ